MRRLAIILIPLALTACKNEKIQVRTNHPVDLQVLEGRWHNYGVRSAMPSGALVCRDAYLLISGTEARYQGLLENFNVSLPLEAIGGTSNKVVVRSNFPNFSPPLAYTAHVVRDRNTLKATVVDISDKDLAYVLEANGLNASKSDLASKKSVLIDAVKDTLTMQRCM